MPTDVEAALRAVVTTVEYWQQDEIEAELALANIASIAARALAGEAEPASLLPPEQALIDAEAYVEAIWVSMKATPTWQAMTPERQAEDEAKWRGIMEAAERVGMFRERSRWARQSVARQTLEKAELAPRSGDFFDDSGDDNLHDGGLGLPGYGLDRDGERMP